MSELISAGILIGLALWGFGCHCACLTHTRKAARSKSSANRQVMILVMMAFLLLAEATSACFAQSAADSARMTTSQQRIKSGVSRQSLDALHSLRFEPTADGSGMVSRFERRAVQINPGGSVEIHSLVSGEAADVALYLEGSNSATIVAGSRALPGHSNYFLGKDPAKWRSGVTQFGLARVDGVYPGINLLYYGNGDLLEHDYQLAPGADPALIRMRVGNSVPRIDNASGDLVVSQRSASTELLRLHKPIAYQAASDGSRELVAANYEQNTDGSFSFALGDYDRSRPLVIDPVITYSTYFGGANDDSINDVKLDAAGNIYLLVQTGSADLPVISQIAGACNGACGPANPGTSPYQYHFYVAKLDPTGQKVVFSSYIGGSQLDIPGALVIAGDGTLYISGETRSPDFPVVNEYSHTLPPANQLGGLVSTTITRLSADGDKILYSSMIGGGLSSLLAGGVYRDYGFSGSNSIGGAPASLAVGPNGIAYLLGEADTLDGELGPFADTKNSSFTSGLGSFIAKFDTTKSGGNSLIYAKTFGATGDRIGDRFTGIALDSKQNLWVSGTQAGAGTTPTPTGDAVQPVCGKGGGSQCGNAYLFELSPESVIIYSTYLGGTISSAGGVPIENPDDIYIDSADNIYVGGQTESIDYPTKNAAFTYANVNPYRNPGYLTKLSPGGKSILYSTYLSGIEPIIAANADGMVAVAGTTALGFPVVNGLNSNPNRSYPDAVVELFDTQKSGSDSLISSGYLGSTEPPRNR